MNENTRVLSSLFIVEKESQVVQKNGGKKDLECGIWSQKESMRQKKRA